jgi:hypothetical protein
VSGVGEKKEGSVFRHAVFASRVPFSLPRRKRGVFSDMPSLRVASPFPFHLGNVSLQVRPLTAGLRAA